MTRKTTRSTPRKTTTKPAPAQAPVKTKPAPSNCGCGCGQPTITAKATFLAGHDARHAGVLGRSLAANPQDPALVEAYNRLTDRLKVKVDGIRSSEAKRIATKTARGVAKAAAEAAYADALKEAGV